MVLCSILLRGAHFDNLIVDLASTIVLWTCGCVFIMLMLLTCSANHVSSFKSIHIGTYVILVRLLQ